MAEMNVPAFLKDLRDHGYEAAKKTIGGSTGRRCGAFLATIPAAELDEWQTIIHNALPDNHTAFSTIRDMFNAFFDINNHWWHLRENAATVKRNGNKRPRDDDDEGDDGKQ